MLSISYGDVIQPPVANLFPHITLKTEILITTATVQPFRQRVCRLPFRLFFLFCHGMKVRQSIPLTSRFYG